MDKLQICVVFVFLASLFTITESACTNKTCESRKRRFTSCDINNIPDKSYIVSMEILNERSKNRCTVGVSYGFNTTQIWVHNGCKALFKVCYLELTTPVRHTTVQSTGSNSTPSNNSSLSGDVKERSSPAGLIGGIIAGVALVIGMIIALILINRRCPNLISKMQGEKSPADYVGNERGVVVLPSKTNGKVIEYSTLGCERDQHYYKDINGPGNPEHISERNSYMDLYDSSHTNLPSADNETYEIVGGNTSLTHVVKDAQNYDDANFSNNFQNNRSKCIAKPSINELLRSKEPNTKEAGFDEEHRKGSFEASTYYELAKPVTDISAGCCDDAKADDSYMPPDSNSYDHAHNNRHRLSTSQGNVYNHSVDNVYDVTHQDDTNTYVNYT